MAISDPIRVTGLRDLQASLKAIDGEAQKQLRVVLNEAATVVVKGAQRRATVKSGAFRSSIKVASSQREARVKGGSAKVPYFGFIEYGGKAGRNRSIVRQFQAGGRTVYPAYYAQQHNILALLGRGLTQLVEQNGLEVDN